VRSRYDSDPEALAWAREKIQRRIEHYRKFERQAAERGTSDPDSWRRIAWAMERDFIGGEGCVIAAFDERLPDLVKLLDESQPAQPEDF
jgi:hypothetical protein